MHSFLACVGGTACIVITIFLFMVVVSTLYQFAKNFIETISQNRQNFIREQTIKNFRQKLSDDAYWFSEDPDTYLLLSDFSSGMNVDSIRQRWRTRRKEAEAKNAQRES